MISCTTHTVRGAMSLCKHNTAHPSVHHDSSVCIQRLIPICSHLWGNIFHCLSCLFRQDTMSFTVYPVYSDRTQCLSLSILSIFPSLFLYFFLFHSHTHTHAHARTRTHTHTHPHPHTHTNIRTHIYSHPYTHVHIDTHMYFCDN